MRKSYAINSIALYIFGFVREIRNTKYDIRNNV